MQRQDLLFEYPDIIKVFHDPEAGLLVHEWLEYNPEGSDNVIFEILDRIFQAFQETGVNKVLIIADKANSAFSPEVQKYVRKIQFPRIIQSTALRYLATVVGANEPVQQQVSAWRDILIDVEEIELNDVLSEEEGREWLSQFPASPGLTPD